MFFHLPSQIWNPASRSHLAITILIASAVLVGCSDKIERVPVRGRVMIDGQPLAYGYVTVTPQGARPALGELDAEGRFTLSTYEEGDGTVLGTHSMTVNAGEVLNSVSVRWHAPKKYAGLSSADLFIEVTRDTDEEKVIEITWDGKAPFVESARSSGEE